MTIREKLLLIQKMSGFTQQDLAGRLGVTFAALNRWINEKAIPRKSSLDKIDELYRSYSGEKQIPKEVLDAKKEIVLSQRKKHPNPIKEILDNHDIHDSFLLALTYHSNRIEGSTLSENETAAILFQNAALSNKNLTEQLEVKNHQTALEYLFESVLAGKPINEELILKLHSILMNGVNSDAGRYRKHAVRILGTYVPTANYLKIPELITSLSSEIQKKTADVIKKVSLIHSRFEQIHPFADGNGRIGRLIMNGMLLLSKLPPAVIKQENRRFYVAYLNKSQIKNDSSLLEEFVCDAVLDGYKILERK